MKNIKVNKILIIISILIIIVVLLISIFNLTTISSKSKTIKLDDSLFNNSILNDLKDKKIQVKNIKKISTVNVINGMSITWYNNDEILLNIKDKKTYIPSIGLLNIKDESFNKLVDGYGDGHMLSPNKEKILYYNNLTNPYRNIYDIKSQNIMEVKMNSKEIIRWIPDGSGYFGLLDGNLFKYDLINKTKKNSIYYNTIKGEIYDADFTKDGQKVYVNSLDLQNNITSIYLINLKHPSNITKILEGKILYYEFINSDSIIVSGKFNNKHGIYYYDIKNNKLNMMLNGYFYKYTLSNNKNKIAYSKQNASGMYTLMVANINKNKIENSVEVFNNSSNIDYFKWSIDDSKLAFIINDNIKNDYLYIADFK